LATALGPVGFAAGWWMRADPAGSGTPAPASPEIATEPASATGKRASQDGPTQPTRSGPDGVAAKPSEPDPVVARTRIMAWVEAGCPGRNSDEIHRLLRAWARAEPWAALQFIHQAARFRERTDAYVIPLTVLMGSDSVAATAWMRRELSDPGIRRSVVEDVVTRTMDEWPAAAFALAQAELPRSHYASRSFRLLATRDPVAALAWYDQAEPEERTARAAALASGWLATDRAAATAWCHAQQSQPHGDAVMRALIGHLADQDPPAAVALLRDGPVSEATRREAVQELSYRHPDLALELIPFLPVEDGRRSFASMFDRLFSEDPDAAVELGRSILGPGQLAAQVRSEWRRWFASDAPGAQAWAQAVRDPEVRRGIETEITTQAIQRDPAAYLSATPSGGSTPGDPAMVNLALAMLAEHDPTAAAHAFTRLAAVAAPERAQSIVIGLARMDTGQALGWARALPVGRARDMALAALAEAGAARPRDAALMLCLDQIDDPVLQLRTRFNAYTNLHERDAEAAGRWLEQQPLELGVRTSWAAILQEGSGPRECYLPPVFD
ncbi:MAG: hypothetical protein IAE82_17445, partial [Opitutaceae bacterium]|nr:hypothetical protein [Opitutaceae bacterium]